MTAARVRKIDAVGARKLEARRDTKMRTLGLLRQVTATLEALAKGDDNAADASLKAIMIEAADARDALAARRHNASAERDKSSAAQAL